MLKLAVIVRAVLLVGVLSVVAINITTGAIRIGAFNTGVYGKTKASKPEVVSILLEVYTELTSS